MSEDEPILDQIKAAQAETRTMLSTSVGSPGAKPGTSPIIEELLAKYGVEDRCQHLQAVPIQPWMLSLPSTTWRCTECAAAHARQSGNISPTEEHTCDFCRRYLPTEGGANFTSSVFRQDPHMIIGSACRRCAADFEAKGATSGQLG